MNEQCLCLLDSKKDDKAAVPVCAQEHERYYPAPPYPTPPVTDHEWAAPVSAGQQERWWGCCACVCAGTWTLLPRSTAPHPTGNWSWMSSAYVCWTARKIMTLTSPTPSPEGSVCTTETLSCAQVSQNPVCAAESILCAQVSRRPLFIYIYINNIHKYIYALELEPDMAASLVAGSPWRRWLRGKSEPQCTYSEKNWEKYIFGSNWIKDDQRELPRKLISICQCNGSNQSLHNMLGRIQHGWPPRICAKMCFRSVFIADCLSDSNICQYIRKLSAAHIASYSVNQTRFIHEHFYDMKDTDSGFPVSLVLAMGSGWI